MVEALVVVGPPVLRYCGGFVSAWWCTGVHLALVCGVRLPVSRGMLGVPTIDIASCLVNLAGHNQLLGELCCLHGVLTTR